MKCIKIDVSKDVKQQFEDNGLIYPYLKSNGKFGSKGSTIFDSDTLILAVGKVLVYLADRKIIEVIE